MQVNEALLHNWFYGNFVVRIVCSLGFSFLMGSIPFLRIVDWLFAGSQTAGGPAFRRAGRLAEAGVPLYEALAAFIPVAIFSHGAGLIIGGVAALFALIGHVFSPWLIGRGPEGRAAEGVLVGATLGFLPELLRVLSLQRGG